MAWSSVPDTQVPSWGALSPSSIPAWGTVPDSQTPNWSEFLSNIITAFQSDAFQFNGFQIGREGTWSLVDDSESPNWSVISTP